MVLEDEQRNAMRLIRLLNGIDTTFTIEGPLASIKEIQFVRISEAADNEAEVRRTLFKQIPIGI